MVLPRLNRAAHGKSYMGYSDAGTLLAALYARGIGRQFHGPMPVDIVREGGEAAVVRALRWLVDQDDESLRSEEHTSELQSLMRNSYAVFCLKKKNKTEQ